uniref:Uncharacterized protein n=1 Tax=Glossina pallidipes TaxID=7398 RepID=A0A1A9ZZ72_GLOPL
MNENEKVIHLRAGYSGNIISNNSNKGSTPTVGSSKINNSGLCTRATANDTRLCWPPLRFFTKRLPDGKSKNFNKASKRSSITFLLMPKIQPKYNKVSLMHKVDARLQTIDFDSESQKLPTQIKQTRIDGFCKFKVTVSFISPLTIAKFKFVGSRPMAKQNNITWMTGKTNMKSITPTLRHMRNKFLVMSALILPDDVNCNQMLILMRSTGMVYWILTLLTF